MVGHLGRIWDVIEEHFQTQIVDDEQIKSGNNQVVKLHCRNGEFLIAKIYPRIQQDPRDRLGVEFGALSFLWKHGIRSIPQPLFADSEEGFAVYEFIPGTRIDINRIGVEDISAAVDFLGSLAPLKEKQDSAVLPIASEACFSGRSYLENIDKRVTMLESLDHETFLHAKARRFLDQDFIPFLKEVKEWYIKTLIEAGSRSTDELTFAQKTLSPSDFGFHNALRRDDGRLVFVDFEYFGWDDPAKMIVDFLHHPAMPMSQEMKKGFLNKVFEVFAQDGTLKDRIQAVYPILGLKWCLIMLNEFLPGSLARRKKANAELSIKDTLGIQLGKVQRKLDEIKVHLTHPNSLDGFLA